MTLRYAKLLDDTKRKAFESVINQGVFSFNLNGEVKEIQIGEDIPLISCKPFGKIINSMRWIIHTVHVMLA